MSLCKIIAGRLPEGVLRAMDRMLQGLRAAAEETRLRILALCGETELSVSELTQILGQSQPRVSRHLKLLVEAGLLERLREGAWAFYRVSERGEAAALAHQLLRLVPRDDATVALDRTRLDAVRASRAERAAEFFKRNAEDWDRIRRLHVNDKEVERALRRLLPNESGWEHVDIGTGTGRILEIVAPLAQRTVGIDLSHEMLTVARSNLANASLANCHVRHGDMHQLPLPTASFDVATFHLVLHYAENPAAAIAEATRVLRPGGRLIVIDFAPHREESLLREHAHRWLGFTDAEIADWFSAAGLIPGEPVHLPGKTLTVCLWSAARTAVPRVLEATTSEGAQPWLSHRS